MITSCSYDSKSLLFLRSQAILPLHYTSAQALNLWSPTAQHNARGQTQPFPFANYTGGIGIITTTKLLSEIFPDMSSSTPADDTWGAAQAQPELSPVTDNKTAPGVTEVTVADEPTGGTTSPMPMTSPTASEVRKSSLADLTNGDRNAINAHLAQRLGPHKFLSRFTSQKTDAELADTAHAVYAAHADLSEPDGAASVVGDSSSDVSTNAAAIKHESTQTITNAQAVSDFQTVPDSQTAPDLENSNLFTGTTPATSVANGIEFAVQSPNQSPRAVRKLGPHHRLKALQAQDIPLPQSPAPVAQSSTSDERPATPVVPRLEVEPAIVQSSPPVTPTADDGNDESDVSSLAYEAFKTELSSSLSDKEKIIDTKAQTPSLNPRAVDYLPPSRSTSPLTPAKSAKSAIDDSEAEYINNCCPVPSNWSIPPCIGSFAGVKLFDDFMIGGVHKPLLSHYSHFFATAFTNDSEVKKDELDQVVKDPSFGVFRTWVYEGKLYLKSADGVVYHDMNIDLKNLVTLWRFAARVQAPLLANTIADAIINKTITADDIVAAAHEIDAIFKVTSVNHTFRLLICHAVILSGIQLGQDDYDNWPKSLLWSILSCLKMGKFTYADIEASSKTNPCMYHLHPLGINCKAS